MQRNGIMAFRAVRETKLQAMQFKILHRTFPCRVYLKTIRVFEEDTRNFFPEQDTTQHFLDRLLAETGGWSRPSVPTSDRNYSGSSPNTSAKPYDQLSVHLYEVFYIQAKTVSPGRFVFYSSSLAPGGEEETPH